MKGLLASLGALVLGLLLVGPVAAPPSGGSMTLVFQRTYDGASMDALAIGPDGSVYTAGMAAGEELYEGSGIFELEAAVHRWSPDGNLLWQVRWGGPGDENAEAIAVDSTGAAYVTGSTSSFGVYFEAFILKFDANGNLVWQRTWGGDREEGGRAVAVGPDGSVYVAGVTQSFGSIFGPTAFLLKLAPDGMVLWERTWDAERGAVVKDMAVSSDGAIYLLGSTDVHPFLVKFAAGGGLVWDRSLVMPGLMEHTTRLNGIAAAPGGGVVAVGMWMPTFDGQVIVAPISADGALSFVREWGGESHENAFDAAVASDGTVYVVGGTQTFAAQGPYEDIFVLKMLSSGRGHAARTWGGPNRDIGVAVALGADGDAYIVGSASAPPYTFDDASDRMTRVRGASLVDEDGVVETPAGTVGTPTGTARPLSGTVGTGATGGAVLLRISPS